MLGRDDVDNEVVVVELDAIDDVDVGDTCIGDELVAINVLLKGYIMTNIFL